MRCAELFEAVFTTAPLKQMAWGQVYRIPNEETDQQEISMYYRLSNRETLTLLKASHLRTVITEDEVYVADAGLAAHRGMRNVLEQYGIDTSHSINTIITGPKRMVYSWDKYYAEQPFGWRAIRNKVLDHPRIKQMFPTGLAFVRDEWT